MSKGIYGLISGAAGSASNFLENRYGNSLKTASDFLHDKDALSKLPEQISNKIPTKYKQTAKELLEKAKNVLRNPSLPNLKENSLPKKIINSNIGQSATRLISDLSNQEKYKQFNPKELLKESLEIAKGSRVGQFASPPVQSALQKIQQNLPKAEESLRSIGSSNINNVIDKLKSIQ